MNLPPYYSAITFPIPAIACPNLAIVRSATLPVAVRPRAIRPPTPLKNPQPIRYRINVLVALIAPVRLGSDFCQLKKRNKIIFEFNSYQTALAESLSTLALTKIQAAETTSKKYRQKLNKKIKSREKEHKKLTKKLCTAELDYAQPPRVSITNIPSSSRICISNHPSSKNQH